MYLKIWQGYNSKRGCTNLQCKGFVQTDKSVTLGEPFKQTSVVDGQTVQLALAIVQVILNLEKNYFFFISYTIVNLTYQP